MSKPFPIFFSYLGYAVVSLAIAITCLEIASSAIFALNQRMHRDPLVDVTPDSPAYAAYDWAKSCISDEEARVKTRYIYVPFRLWGVTEWHGVCINNDRGELGTVRRTINSYIPACATQPGKSIWVMGGSTVYGTRVPDWATLPSYLSRELNRIGCWQVTNLGVEGYATNQEVIYLTQLLKTGRHPDILILYDGFNDADLGSTLPESPAPHMEYDLIRNRFEGSATGRLDFVKRSNTWQLFTSILSHRQARATRQNGELNARAIAALDNYEQNLRIVRALAQNYGSQVLAFWQPALIYGHKPLAAYEQSLLDLSPRFSLQDLVPVYEEAEHRATATGNFIFLGNLFDHRAEPLYLDWAHLNPSGNRAVAQALAEYVRSQPHAERKTDATKRNPTVK